MKKRNKIIQKAACRRCFLYDEMSDYAHRHSFLFFIGAVHTYIYDINVPACNRLKSSKSDAWNLGRTGDWESAAWN